MRRNHFSRFCRPLSFHFCSTATGKIKPALMALGEDKDPDVKFYSAQALAAC
jgi:hypothetical protein